jgi:hypothetical protein
MKTVHAIRSYKWWALLLAGVWGMSCGKQQADPTEGSIRFDGNARLKGELYVENIATGILDTAYRAEILLYQTGHRDNALVMTLPKGTFEINNLASDTYTLEARLDRRPGPGLPAVVYKYMNPSLHLNKDEQRLDMRLNLEPDLASLAEPALKLTISDASGYRRPNARVCLYAAENVLLQNYRKCGGSFQTRTTNSQGVVIFTGLEAKTYYVAALAPNGRDSLTNVGGSVPLSVGPLTAAGSSLPVMVAQSSVPAASPVPPGLRLTVVDDNNIVLPAARVCLYPALAYLTGSGLSCLSSLRSDSTNAQGQVTFASLQANTTYYAKAVKTLGNTTLTNLGATGVQAVTTNAQGLRSVTITVRQ